MIIRHLKRSVTFAALPHGCMLHGATQKLISFTAAAALILSGCASSGSEAANSSRISDSAASIAASSAVSFGQAYATPNEEKTTVQSSPNMSSHDDASADSPFFDSSDVETTDAPEDSMQTLEIPMITESDEQDFGTSETISPTPTSANRIHYLALDPSSASDSMLIESNGIYMLVDNSNPDVSTGGSQAVSNDAANVNAVIAYLRSIGVEHLDYMVLTHNHSDHLGGTKRLCEEGFVDSRTTVYYRCGWETADYYDYPDWENLEYLQTALDAVYGAGAEVICLMADNITELTLSVGSFRVDFLNLDSDHDGEVDFHYDDENENSIVLKVTLGTVDTLLASDILARTEAPLADEIGPVEVLKAPHHGTESSSSYEFLSVLRPEAVVITCVYYIQNGAFEYLRSLGSESYPTALATGTAIIENVWEDHYSFENAQSYDIPVADGIYEWLDHSYCMKDNTLMKDYSVYQDERWYYFNEEGILEP